ncbi:MAG: transcriptional repressor [Lachnoclostridium sp.]|jgi:Fe2+ or Zn2+ uptake regulation protein|nr:transcriptional repressor [Lachnoclostridium sp.]
MKNKRLTVQRQLILDSVKELNKHATAEQVYEDVNKKYPTISKATVYRNLRQMAESGELLNIGSFLGSAHYDHNCHMHYHFICKKCGKVYDVNEFYPDINDRITDMDGFDVKHHNLTFYGLCPNCKTTI